MVINSASDLDAFRRECTGRRVLELICLFGGRVLIDWQIGVGKSHNIDDLIEAAIRDELHDLVIVLSPTRQVLNERRWIRDPPRDVRIVNLRPRPTRRCAELDGPWRRYEQLGLGTLGKAELCTSCPRRLGCPWPRQYGDWLAGARVVYATIAHLIRDPHFVPRLKNWTRAERVLLIVDEGKILTTNLRRTVSYHDLGMFVEVVKALDWSSKVHSEWNYRSDLLMRATTADLRSPDWKMPYFPPKWALAVQTAGRQRYGDAFRFLAYDLQEFGLSRLASRERTRSGDVSFAAVPHLGCEFVLYSGTANREFASFRLGTEIVSPFDGYQFSHSGTRWYNLASRLGTRRFFVKNADQILDFFAALVAQRIREGRRVLLVSKKCFADLCATEMNRRLEDHGIKDSKVVHVTQKRFDSSLLSIMPLITYGAVGINDFEEYDCAFCLNSYFISEAVVDTALQDVLASDGHIPIKILTGGNPRRRRASVTDQRHSGYDVNRLAQHALDEMEMGVVLQAVGRVRPYTRPREIFTFQCADHPKIGYTCEFSTLGEARRHFDISDRRTRKRHEMVTAIHAAQARGMTQPQIAKELGVSTRTIKRYCKLMKVPTSL